MAHRCMSVGQLVGRLEELRATVWVEGDHLHLDTEQEPEPEVVEALRSRKMELLGLLRQVRKKVTAAEILSAVAPPPGEKRKTHTTVADLAAQGWPPESADYVRRFGRPSSRLYPFLGGRIMTPNGPGELLQVLKSRCAVRLDSDPGRPRFFLWKNLGPIESRIV